MDKAMPDSAKEKVSHRLERLDRLASSRLPIEETMPLSDYGYCLKMRTLYANYKKGLITLESAKRRKKMIVEEYYDYQEGHWVYTLYQHNIVKSEELKTAIHKSRDLEDMLDKSLECITLMTGDEAFYKENAKKFKDGVF